MEIHRCLWFQLAHPSQLCPNGPNEEHSPDPRSTGVFGGNLDNGLQILTNATFCGVINNWRNADILESQNFHTHRHHEQNQRT